MSQNKQASNKKIYRTRHPNKRILNEGNDSLTVSLGAGVVEGRSWMSSPLGL